ncbi:MAG TPA: uroporphyrinogen decarboxylase family protein [Chloroflexota bacterium]
MADELTPRERVLAFLRHEVPDRVPWAESGIDLDLQAKIMGTIEFEPAELCRKLGMDAFGGGFLKSVQIPGNPGITDGQTTWTTEDFDSYYYPTSITFDFVPPWIAEMGIGESTGRSYVKKGLLTSRESLALFDRYLPDPDHPARYERVARWIDRYREEFAVFARLRLGSASTLESMGIDVFGYMLYDDPDLIHEVHGRFSEWSAKVVRHLNELDFDFYWVADDVAANNGPFMSPKAFREFFMPHMKSVANEIKRPWIYHSDGNLSALMPDLLTLGMNAIHPIQPSVMEIGQVKREYGDRVGLVGNIDLDYTLTRGTPEEVDAEVRERIQQAAPGGGYMISSANSLTDYCKLENVFAMAQAVQEYGRYPIQAK